MILAFVAIDAFWQNSPYLTEWRRKLRRLTERHLGWV